MKIIKSILEMQDYSSALAKKKVKVGFVPTLGCLHFGHVDLFRRAKLECDLVVASLFVNPLQFKKDKFESYPRNLEEDIRIATDAKVDVLFAPETSQMYPASRSDQDLFSWQESDSSRPSDNFQLGGLVDPQFVRVPGRLCNKMDGYLHPWHYDGVATVVYKLFGIIGAVTAYFGEKDPQQIAVIENMVEAFNLPVTVRRVPTLRDSDGLPFSSRNTLLTAEQRSIALRVAELVRSLMESRGGNKYDAQLILQEIKKSLDGLQKLDIHYLGIVHPFTLDDLENICEGAILYIAYSVSGIRLTDNYRFM